MKKTLPLLLITILLSIAARAQYVTITDTNFAAYLQLKVPGCMNGKQLDTACAKVADVPAMDMTQLGITDIAGIENFTGLDTLICAFNSITVINALPPNLQYFDCSYNAITSLPAMPNSLTYFDCDNNMLYSLPDVSATSLYLLECTSNYGLDLVSINLPSSLNIFECSSDYATGLPTLPDGLQILNCSTNLISGFLTLPSSLGSLDCNSNLISSLGVLPPGLQTLYCSFNSLDTLPSLPSSLTYLDCSYNQLTSLPALPSSLNTIYCDYNILTALPVLPGQLNALSCTYNQLTALPSLPAQLQYLLFDSNQVATAPTFPQSLFSLTCAFNLFTTLTVPTGLTTFTWGGSNITTIPTIPSSVQQLTITNSAITAMPPLTADYYHAIELVYNPLLTSIPALGRNIFSLDLIGDSSLQCLPTLDTVSNLYFTGTLISCFPNYPAGLEYSNPSINNYPLCNGTNGCTAYWNISGLSYFDANNDCINDGGDQPMPNMNIQLYSNGVFQQQVSTNSLSVFSFKTDTAGIYNVVLDTTGLPFVATCAGNTFNDTLTAQDTTNAHNDFSLRCKSGYDLAAWSIVASPLNPIRTAEVNMAAGDVATFYGVHCASGVSGLVTATISGPAAYYAPAPGSQTPLASDSSSVTWVVTDFGASNFFSDFNFLIKPFVTAVPGDEVCITLTVSPTNDNDPSNNTLVQCFPVLTSFDPNEKDVFPSGDIDTGQQWLTYTIHFQNTGNDTAHNIYLLDTLDSHLDANTFQLLNYSNPVVTQLLTGGIIRFTFSNINLVDTANSQTASIGYVQYKIKLKTGLTLGDQVQNTASVYFDLNAPVQTNTTLNTISLTAGINTMQNNSAANISLYPNPSAGSWQLAVGNELLGSTLQIFDDEGRLVLKSEIRNSKSEINLEVTSGVYYLCISNAAGNVVRKLVKI